VNVGLALKAVFPGPSGEILRAQRLTGEPAHPQIMTSGLFTEMQGLVRQFNSDSCPCRDENRPTAALARLVHNDENGLRMAAREAGRSPQQDRQKAGSKMTMAVVFQIENLPEKEQSAENRSVENKMDDIVEVVDLGERRDRFVTVSNVEHGRGTPQHECTHHSHLAD
jgi:hypothetical protein